MSYRKKPVVIEAFQMTEARRSNDSDWPIWLIKAWDTEGVGGLSPDSDTDGKTLVIGTLEGVHKVTPNDWIIQGIKGELYPCKPDIFEATYEEV